MRPAVVWAVFSASLDGDEYPIFELVSVHARAPTNLPHSSRADFDDRGRNDAIPGPLPRAYSLERPPEVLFAERLEVLP